MAAPPSSVPAVAVRRMKWVGQLHRSTSSVAASSRPGSARSRSHCSGCSQKASTPWAMAIRVVSFPAMTRIEKKLSRSVSLSRSPSTSARSSVDSRSSPGSAQPVPHDLAAQVPQLLAVGAAERVPAVGVGVVAAPDDVGDLRVGVGDQPVAEVDEGVQAVPGQPHDPGQHPDRHLLGHGVHEVEVPAGQPGVQDLLGEPLDEVLVDRHRPLREAPGHDLAELGVLGRVGVDDGAPGRHVLIGRLLEGDPARRRERRHVAARGHDVAVAVDGPEPRVRRGLGAPGDGRLAPEPGKLPVGDSLRPHVEVGQVDSGGHGS